MKAGSNVSVLNILSGCLNIEDRAEGNIGRDYHIQEDHREKNLGQLMLGKELWLGICFIKILLNQQEFELN